jgi:5-formyltetrahydrofolate cyclo-ligase
MSEHKAEIRREMRRIRAGIVDRRTRSLRVCEAVIRRLEPATGSPHSLLVLAFVGVGSEPDTSTLIDRLVAGGHAVALPRVEGTDLVAVRWKPGSPLAIGPFEIPAPAGPPLDPAAVDVAIVPGLAFTADGRRLGQGGGFYDRFLPLLRSDCLTIGIGFAEQLVDDIPTDAHDRILDLVITDAVSE